MLICISTVGLLLACQNQDALNTKLDKGLEQSPESNINYQDTSLEKNDIASSTTKQDTSLQYFANKAIECIENQDFISLSEMVGTKGLRFSPYQHIDKNSVLFKASELKTIFENDSVITWGVADGSGEKINLTFKDYYQKYIYDKNYIDLEPNWGQIKASGNSINNIKEFYPNSRVVEYYFPGTDEYRKMDWKSLFLVFKKENQHYSLVGIVHGQWTI